MSFPYDLLARFKVVTLRKKKNDYIYVITILKVKKYSSQNLRNYTYMMPTFSSVSLGVNRSTSCSVLYPASHPTIPFKRQPAIHFNTSHSLPANQLASHPISEAYSQSVAHTIKRQVIPPYWLAAFYKFVFLPHSLGNPPVKRGERRGNGRGEKTGKKSRARSEGMCERKQYKHQVRESDERDRGWEEEEKIEREQYIKEEKMWKIWRWEKLLENSEKGESYVKVKESMREKWK